MPASRDQLLPLYDGRPAMEALLARCKRDKVDSRELRELIVESRSTTGRAYALHAYGVPTVERKAVRLEDGTLGHKEVPAWIVYRTQRNGTISNGWGFPVPHTKILVVVDGPLLVDQAGHQRQPGTEQDIPAAIATPNAEGGEMTLANPKVPMTPDDLARHYKELDAAAYFSSAAEGEQAARANERQMLLEIALDASPLEGVLQKDDSFKPAAKAGEAAARALALRTLLSICEDRAAQWTPQSLARTIEKDSKDALEGGGGYVCMGVLDHQGAVIPPANLERVRMCDIAALRIVAGTEDGATFAEDPIDLTSPTALADLGKAVVSVQVRMAEHLRTLEPAEGEEESGQTAPRQRFA